MSSFSLQGSGFVVNLKRPARYAGAVHPQNQLCPFRSFGCALARPDSPGALLGDVVREPGTARVGVFHTRKGSAMIRRLNQLADRVVRKVVPRVDAQACTMYTTGAWICSYGNLYYKVCEMDYYCHYSCTTTLKGRC